jgi:3'(2'), 5'-bisphosphate nucleotidase
MSTELASLLDALVPLARQAGELILEVYGTDFAVIDKGHDDPVTLADRRANALICESLARLCPGVPLVAEESDPSTYAGYPDAPEAFFVDPLDGTREFVARNGEFVVMIGLARAGRAVAGVVLAPVTGRLWVGAEGVGAHELSRSGERRPLHVNNVGAISGARLVVSRSRRSEQLDRLIAANPPREVIPRGSAGLKAIAVASGEADAYLQLSGAGCLWDTCAPEAIARAAGATFSHADGTPISYRSHELPVSSVLAAPPALHDLLLQAAARL